MSHEQTGWQQTSDLMARIALLMTLAPDKWEELQNLND